MAETDSLHKTPLFDLHTELGGRMVPFAGYSMPVQYEGILAEHRWTREHAGLFDVSHMGQRLLTAPDHDRAAAALERLVPGEIQALGRGRMRYTLLLNEEGGIVDDLMVTRPASGEDDGMLLMVFNAARKEADDAHMRDHLPGGVTLTAMDDRALLALQGPEAAAVMARHCPKAGELSFMGATSAEFDGIDCTVSRSGYTGEDGFEISVKAEDAERLARALLADPQVRPIGLGARDSLRLEAGLPLYGHDIDETISPIEADLGFAVSKRRRAEGGFLGAERILRELEKGPSRTRVGIRPAGRAPVREGVRILSEEGAEIGAISSGGFGPTINGPVAMGYVAAGSADPGTPLRLDGRRGPEPAEVAPLPFVPHRYHRKS